MMKKNSPWIAPDWVRLPDFIICGAMKAGTSSLHDMLNKHPDVFIPKDEVHFFDIDNLLEHPDFSFFENNRWVYQDINANQELFWNWYNEKFRYTDKNIIGEDSTNYLNSRNAPKRIAAQSKPIKLIIMLRDPVSRAYSNYFHNVRTGRATETFEKTLLYHPHQILSRSMYLEQIERYLKCFDRSQIKFVLFEEFIENKKEVFESVCEFLDLGKDWITPEVLNIYSNKAQIPKNLKLQLLRNKWLRGFGNMQYVERLPLHSPRTKEFTLNRFFNKFHSLVNQQRPGKPPKITQESKDYLRSVFSVSYTELENLSGVDIKKYW